LASISDGQARTYPEIEVAGSENVIRPMMYMTSPLCDPNASVLGAVGVFSDLTPLKELEIERRRAERLAYFEVLASGIAHEIKNPLVAIKAFTQLVPRRHYDEMFVNEFSRIVGREIERMERLLERLGALSRPARRVPCAIDIRAPMAEALEVMRATFDERGVQVKTSIEDTGFFVLGHHAELEQLFLNLLVNAHEATSPGGTISFEIVHTSQHVVVSIADNGRGIAPEHVERIFDPFFSTKERGSGLGLAICAGIAQMHGARLRAANLPGGGSVVYAEFPKSQPAPITT
jgi:signal transduction histidine kinase